MKLANPVKSDQETSTKKMYVIYELIIYSYILINYNSL